MKKSVTTPPMVDGTSLRTGPLALLYSTVRLWRDVRKMDDFPINLQHTIKIDSN